MKVVWQRDQPATVRDVYEALLEHRKIAYTTVMTMMKILEAKGHLQKSQFDKAHLYSPTKPKQQVIQGMVREFIDRVFNGSAEPLLAHLVDDEKLTAHDLEELTRIVRKGKS